MNCNPRLEAIVLTGSAITKDIVRMIHDNGILGASGFYGDPTIGDPLQIDRLDIEHPGGPTRITLYNRAIMLFTTNEKFYVQAHRVCCAIDRRCDQVRQHSGLAGDDLDEWSA